MLLLLARQHARQAAAAATRRGLVLSSSSRGSSCSAAAAAAVAAAVMERSAVAPNDVCIAAVARTPCGAFQGALAALSAADLGALAIRGALERAAGVDPARDVDEVFMGLVCSAGCGQAPATQAARKAGLPSSVPATAVNKVCASGMKAVVLAAQTILAGDNAVVVAGGMESMSNVPHYCSSLRGGGLRLGDAALVDGLVRDGLWDPGVDAHMGSCAELCAAHYGVSREAMDDHALEAFARARAAAPYARAEIVAVPLPPSAAHPGGGRVLDVDEALGKLDADKLRRLKPPFKGLPPRGAAAAGPAAGGGGGGGGNDGGGNGAAADGAGGGGGGGAVTAGNSSPITDGACALVLMSGAKALELGAPVLAVLRGYGDANQEPEWFTTAPAAAVPRALARAGLAQDQIDFWEINQAFSVVDLVNRELLGLDASRVNVHGGAVALGHPLGASGAIIIGRLISVLRAQGGRYGLAAICNGGGGASAVVIELVRAAGPAAQL